MGKGERHCTCKRNQENDCSGLPISIPHAPNEMKPMTQFR